MEEDSSPARTVVTRSPWRTVRILNFPGVFDAPVECESSLERDFAYRAILCPSVARLRHQPFKLRLDEDRVYTPDFLVTHQDGAQCVVEVKTEERVRRYRDDFDRAAELLAQRGASFLVLTERALLTDDAHERAAYVLRYRKSVVDPQLRVFYCRGCNVPGRMGFTSLTSRAIAARRHRTYFIWSR